MEYVNGNVAAGRLAIDDGSYGTDGAIKHWHFFHMRARR
jgi:hypothetical protein